MKILILFNPIAGAGRAAQSATEIAAALRQANHEPVLAPTRIAPDSIWLDDLMQPVDAAVIVGGDGAVRLASGSAARTDTPLYLWPAGTENLFAREFGYRADTAQMMQSLERAAKQSVDMGIINDRPFMVMVSVGLDADIVHDLDTRRTGAITHLSYVMPILRQAIQWSPPRLTIETDGECLVDARRGSIVIANSRQYAMRINPAWRASMDDGLLDVLFLPGGPCRSVLYTALFRLRLGRKLRGIIYRQCQSVRICCDAPQHYQLDGDAPDICNESGNEGANEGDSFEADRRVIQLRARLAQKKLTIILPTADASAQGSKDI